MKHLIHYRIPLTQEQSKYGEEIAQSPRTNRWSNATLIKRTEREDSYHPKAGPKSKNSGSIPAKKSDGNIPQGFMWLAAVISLESIDLVL